MQPPAAVTHDKATLSPAANDINAELLTRGFLRNGEVDYLEEESPNFVEASAALAASNASGAIPMIHLSGSHIIMTSIMGMIAAGIAARQLVW